MNKKYTHIFFDLDNTLWDFNKNSRVSIYEAYIKFKLNSFGVDFDKFFDVYTIHNDSLWGQYRKKEIHKNELKRQRFQKTFEELQIIGIDPVAMNDYYLEVMPLQTILMDGALEVLKSLKSKNYKLFVITNGFSEVQHRKMENSGLAPFFEKIFISEEVKSPKPERVIFEYAITSANARKSKSVMIGDDWEVDIMGALNIGITGIYYCPNLMVEHKVLIDKYTDSEVFVVCELRDLLSQL